MYFSMIVNGFRDWKSRLVAEGGATDWKSRPTAEGITDWYFTLSNSFSNVFILLELV